jgi:hypothetical protein
MGTVHILSDPVGSNVPFDAAPLMLTSVNVRLVTASLNVILIPVVSASLSEPPVCTAVQVMGVTTTSSLNTSIFCGLASTASLVILTIAKP